MQNPLHAAPTKPYDERQLTTPRVMRTLSYRRCDGVNFYMDDLLKSVPTTDEAIRLAHQLIDLLKKGGFRLTKWLSNSREVIQALPKSELASC